MSYDLFICHASKDKPIVGRLVSLLEDKGIKVWYDDDRIKIGHSIIEVINEGINKSNYGLVILSPNFFDREWPKWELGALFVKKSNDPTNVVLPILHNFTLQELKSRYAMLAGFKCLSTNDDGLEAIVKQVLEVIGPKQAQLTGKGRVSHQWFWSRRPKEIEDINLKDARFMNRYIGWIVGDHGTILHTEDGG